MQIEVIENIEHLADSLRRLDVQSNRLRGIGDALVPLVNLTELYLAHNAIESLQGLQTLKQLTTLVRFETCHPIESAHGNPPSLPRKG